ncbi:hypothetical protein JHK82_041432 [Glycine max]|uniref:Uncharacterized protein n=1 Tax=Glycine max TaxID=3847 RepID=K7M9P6_SOYBN|nr:hypothetical protein JHK86_041489 [Glycine max]KAG4955717.1 hypothetical protein JHK85_042097 [Glycine max]KAG5104462.1 hypothetical protein JHK82_041432 [Glycine max]KAG5115585.1 hypothetical protein JHK84_041698 [Glycine max]KAH1145652.1 hypothetical protein GYH30_041393 [Glycine max]
MKLLESKKRAESRPESSENPSDTDPPHKKTRDLPNLTECHACGFKVDVCTGKNRLRTLYSEWRVVLLCKKCFSSVESSQICSYCFSGASPESFRCNQCLHSVHKSCFLKYKNAAPWSYACLGSEFSVCVDCWIPKHLAISRRRNKIGVKNGKNGRVMPEKGSPRVFGGGNLVRSMEDLVEDAKRAVGEKVEAAARARDEAMQKAMVARSALEIANNALSLVANREESSLNLPPKMDAVKVLDGSELTFELHPRFNSLPRISKSCCLLNVSYLDTPKRWTSSVDLSCKTSKSRNASDRDKHEISNDSVGAALDSGSLTDLNLLCMGTSGMETGLRAAEFGSEGIGEELLNEGEGSCSDRLINFSEDSGMELDHKQADSPLHREEQCIRQPDRYFFKYSRRCNGQPDSALHTEERCNGQPDHYFFKYSSALQPGSALHTEEQCNGQPNSALHTEEQCNGQPNSALHTEKRCNGQPDRYFFKYSRRSRSLNQI